jgi:hypothetical protein
VILYRDYGNDLATFPLQHGKAPPNERLLLSPNAEFIVEYADHAVEQDYYTRVDAHDLPIRETENTDRSPDNEQGR